jgi:hypothetical protein
MPWTESRVDARLKFIQDYVMGHWPMSKVARQHGISR